MAYSKQAFRTFQHFVGFIGRLWKVIAAAEFCSMLKMSGVCFQGTELVSQFAPIKVLFVYQNGNYRFFLTSSL